MREGVGNGEKKREVMEGSTPHDMHTSYTGVRVSMGTVIMDNCK